MTDEMIHQFTILVDFLGKALGPAYEITLHDIRPNHNIIAIANGRVSGRAVGSPMTDTVRYMLSQKEYEHCDYRLNYTSQLTDGKVIRSSTMFIKDEEETPIGLLCINFDDSRFHALTDNLLRQIHPDEFIQNHYPTVNATDPLLLPVEPSTDDRSESFHGDMDDLMQNLFYEVAQSIGAPMNRLTLHERIQVISRLNEMGMFRLKGSVQFTAERLSCSQASIYRYLTQVKEEES